MNRTEFARRLEKGPLLFDGAMGSLLYERGVLANRCYDELSLSAPDRVTAIHADYARAGAEALETNTFGAHRSRLAAHGLTDKIRDINLAAVKLARKVAEEATATIRPLVAGAIGPSAGLPPGVEATAEAIEQEYGEQLAALIAGGVDLLLVETQTDAHHAALLARLIRRQSPDLPLIVQFAVDPESLSIRGVGLAQAAGWTREAGADVVGLNCAMGPQEMFGVLQALRGTTTLPLSAQPNAGSPKMVEGRRIYMTTPEYMTHYAKRYLALGARIVGGCCGTTPAHIAAMRGLVRATAARDATDLATLTADGHAGGTDGGTSERVSFGGSGGWVQVSPAVEVSPTAAHGVKPLPTEKKSGFAHKLRHKPGFVVSVEMSPPVGPDLAPVLEKARRMNTAGVDCINIPDGPRAVARMAPTPMACVLERELGQETIVHVCARDRNRLALQADMMGLGALGIRNVVLITGDPPKMGDYPDATGVFDLEAVGLCRMARDLNRALDMAGKPIGGRCPIHFGVGCDPSNIDREKELRRLHEKLRAGAEFVMTQPVYDPAQLAKFLADAALPRDFPIMVGVLPLASIRNAEFLHNEVPGMRIPEDVLERMRQVGSGPAARSEGVAIAREAVLAAKDLPGVRGFYVMPPLGLYDLAIEVLRPLGTAALPGLAAYDALPKPASKAKSPPSASSSSPSVLA